MSEAQVIPRTGGIVPIMFERNALEKSNTETSFVSLCFRFFTFPGQHRNGSCLKGWGISRYVSLICVIMVLTRRNFSGLDLLMAFGIWLSGDAWFGFRKQIGSSHKTGWYPSWRKSGCPCHIHSLDGTSQTIPL